jgi:hypothetical protein
MVSRYAAHEVHVHTTLDISEQRIYCKIRVQLGFPPTEIHAGLQKVSWNGALKYATVCKEVRRFNDGRKSIENDSRVSRPVSVLTKFCENVN